jgi:hypothetical protein
MFFFFLLKLSSETFPVLRRCVRDITKFLFWSSRKIPVGQSLTHELEYFLQIFEKYSNIKFDENISIGSPVVACGQSGKASCRFSQFCVRA